MVFIFTTFITLCATVLCQKIVIFDLIIVVCRMNATGLDGYTGDTSVYDIDPWTGAAFRIHHRIQACRCGGWMGCVSG